MVCNNEKTWVSVVKSILRSLTTGTIIVIAAAIIYQHVNVPSEDQRKTDVLNALRSIERNFVKPEIPPKGTDYSIFMKLTGSRGIEFARKLNFQNCA